MKTLTTHPEAASELEEALDYHEAQVASLGEDLAAEVGRALERLRANPQGCSPYGRTGYRKCFVSRFKYTIFFSESTESIWIAAVAHGSRRPGYWHDRSPDDPGTQTLSPAPSPDAP